MPGAVGSLMSSTLLWSQFVKRRNFLPFNSLKTIVQLSFLLLLGAEASQAQLSYSNPVTLGTVDFGALRQASGVAASRNNLGVLWTHNDAGDGPRIFAIDTQGRLLGTYNLSGATQVDYEDIAIGPGPNPNVSYIYLGDIGDNNSSRSTITVYRIPEPAVYSKQAGKPGSFNLKGFQAITLSYADGAHNAETLIVDPISGDLFVGTKQADVCRFYQATKSQLDTGGPISLAFVCEVTFNTASGGSISPSGREIALRQEDFAQLWKRLPGQSIADALTGPSISIPVVGRPNEANGEAIGFDWGGYFTLSDSSTTQPLRYFARARPAAQNPPRLLVPAGSSWRYLDTGVNLGSTWTGRAFDDSTWKTGDGQFGYGDGDEQTVVSFGPNGNNRFITTYFRKSFSLTNVAAFSQLEVKLLFDDGAVVYLNGTPVVRANLDVNPAFNTLATSLQEDLEDAWFSYAIPASLLVEGTNTLAVEVHQAATTSPDLSFDLALLGWEPPLPEILSAKKGSNGALELNVAGAVGGTVTLEMSTNLQNFREVGSIVLTNGLGLFSDPTIMTNSLNRFYRLRH